MSWTTFADITTRWVGEGVPTDQQLVETLIADAEQVILASYPAIQTRIDSGALPIERVILVVNQIVSRVLRNPDGLTTWQQNTGPFGQLRNFADGKTGIHITDAEVRLLAPTRGGKAFEVDLGHTATGEYATDSEDVIWQDA